jgi:RimJ/RimL family protein N-acetyltransferase
MSAERARRGDAQASRHTRTPNNPRKANATSDSRTARAECTRAGSRNVIREPRQRVSSRPAHGQLRQPQRRRRVGLQLHSRTLSVVGGVGLDGSPGDDSPETALGYWLGQPYWGNKYGREAVAAIIEYGFHSLGLGAIRAFTDPSNAASQKVLLACGLEQVGEIDLTKPTRHGASRAPLFRVCR